MLPDFRVFHGLPYGKTADSDYSRYKDSLPPDVPEGFLHPAAQSHYSSTDPADIFHRPFRSGSHTHDRKTLLQRQMPHLHLLQTVLTDGRSDGGKNFSGITMKFPAHHLDGMLPHASDRSSPPGMGKSDRMVYGIYKIKRYTVSVKSCQNQSRFIRHQPVHIRIRPFLCHTIAPAGWQRRWEERFRISSVRIRPIRQMSGGWIEAAGAMV